MALAAACRFVFQLVVGAASGLAIGVLAFVGEAMHALHHGDTSCSLGRVHISPDGSFSLSPGLGILFFPLVGIAIVTVAHVVSRSRRTPP